MLTFEWSDEGAKNTGLSDGERSVLERMLGAELERLSAESEKIWKKQQASIDKLYRKHKSQFDETLKIELKKINISPKLYDADMSEWIKAGDTKLRDQLGQKINKVYIPVLQGAFGSLGNDLFKLQENLEKAVVRSPSAKFKWIGPIGFMVVE